MIRVGASAAEARRALAAAFRAAGLSEADLDARVIVAEASGVDPAVPGEAARKPLVPDIVPTIEALAARRLAREPIARLFGRREFHGRDFRLNAACLVPRPDTETVIAAALKVLPVNRATHLLDLGVGPGTILLTLLAERPLARGLGVDLSATALDMARDNAVRLGVSDRADFEVGSWFAQIASRFDLIVSNPPYISSADHETLEPEVRDHDPRLALVGGADGLDAYRAILASAMAHLVPGGHLVLELGFGQAKAVGELARRAGFTFMGIDHDLGGVERALTLAS